MEQILVWAGSFGRLLKQKGGRNFECLAWKLNPLRITF